MIERPKQKHGIGTLVSAIYLSCIADFKASNMVIRLGLGSLAGLFHMQRHYIGQVHFVTLSGKPTSVNAGTSTNIENDGRGRR
jgi:hypothetical protein